MSNSRLKDILEHLNKMRIENSIGEVFNYVIENNLLQESQKIIDFDLDDLPNKEYYDNIMQIQYSQVIQASKVVEEQTPFSTKHGTKGAEYENVLVVIDDDA